MKYWLVKRVSWHAVPADTESEALDKYRKYQFKASAMVWDFQPVEIQPQTMASLDYLKAAEEFHKRGDV